MSKKCINCGAELDDDQLFCDDCGTKQIVDSQPKTKKQEPTPTQKATVTEADKQAVIQAKADAKKEEKARKREERKNNPKHLAIISLILGIVSYLSILAIIVPIVTSVLGIVLGFFGLKSEKKKTAISGIAVSISFIVFFIAILVFA